MADIAEAVSANEIKNGTVVVTVYPTGPTASNNNNNSVYNKPVIADIENKYADKFDDLTYYSA
jgi:hypothetical protein